MAASMSQRERLITANEKLERMDYDIKNTHQVALETIEVGVGILGDLDDQTEKLKKMKGDVSSISSTLQTANSILHKMKSYI